MKKRVRKIANFFAFNLLFFALYLNFIHKDKMSFAANQQNGLQNAAFSGTVLVDNPEQATEKKNETTEATQQTPQEKHPANNTTALKLSIN